MFAMTFANIELSPILDTLDAEVGVDHLMSIWSPYSFCCAVILISKSINWFIHLRSDNDKV